VTAAGVLVLRVLSDGQPRTVQQVAQATGRCARLTRATLQGALVAGLVEIDAGPPPLYTATEAGLSALAEVGG
jgi:hypothetical protein